MARQKTYDELTSEIEKLMAQQEAMKTKKLEALTGEIAKKFNKDKNFQSKILTTEDAVLKEVANFVINNFDNFASNARDRVAQKK